MNIQYNNKTIDIEINFINNNIQIILIDKLIRYISLTSIHELKYIEALTHDYTNNNNYITLLQNIIKNNDYVIDFYSETSEYILIFNINIFGYDIQHRVSSPCDEFIIIIKNDE